MEHYSTFSLWRGCKEFFFQQIFGKSSRLRLGTEMVDAYSPGYRMDNNLIGLIICVLGFYVLCYFFLHDNFNYLNVWLFIVKVIFAQINQYIILLFPSWYIFWSCWQDFCSIMIYKLIHCDLIGVVSVIKAIEQSWGWLRETKQAARGIKSSDL